MRPFGPIPLPPTIAPSSSSRTGCRSPRNGGPKAPASGARRGDSWPRSSPCSRNAGACGWGGPVPPGRTEPGTRGAVPCRLPRTTSATAPSRSRLMRSRCTTRDSPIGRSGRYSITSWATRRSTAPPGGRTSGSTSASRTWPPQRATTRHSSGCTTTSCCGCRTTSGVSRHGGGSHSSCTSPSPLLTSSACSRGRGTSCRACSRPTSSGSTSPRTPITFSAAPSACWAAKSTAAQGWSGSKGARYRWRPTPSAST